MRALPCGTGVGAGTGAAVAVRGDWIEGIGKPCSAGAAGLRVGVLGCCPLVVDLSSASRTPGAKLGRVGAGADAAGGGAYDCDTGGGGWKGPGTGVGGCH